MVGGCWGRGSAPRGGRRTVSGVRRDIRRDILASKHEKHNFRLYG